MVDNVQALRGVAALLVLWDHMKDAYAALSPASTANPLVASGLGAIGVDLFFIISGYVISLAACKRHAHPLEFFLARLARIAPLYLVYVLVFLIAKSLLLHEANSFSSVWNGLFYLPFFDMASFTLPPGGVGWTLSFEMWFYVVFALLLNLGTPDKIPRYLTLLFFAGAPLMFFYSGAWYFPRFMFHPFVLEFAFGCIIYQLQARLSSGWSVGLIAGGVAFFLAFSRNTDALPYACLTVDHQENAWLRVLLWGLPWALIAAGAVGLERTGRFRFPRLLVWIGGFSYSLYLSHQLSISLLGKVGPRIGMHGFVAVTLLVPLICIFNAWLCWVCLERPLTVRAQRLAKKWAPRPA